MRVGYAIDDLAGKSAQADGYRAIGPLDDGGKRLADPDGDS